MCYLSLRPLSAGTKSDEQVRPLLSLILTASFYFILFLIVAKMCFIIGHILVI